VQHRKQTTHPNDYYQQYKEEKPTHKNTTRPKKKFQNNKQKNQGNLITVHENIKAQNPSTLYQLNLILNVLKFNFNCFKAYNISSYLLYDQTRDRGVNT
jgi:hypothetical protein